MSRGPDAATLLERALLASAGTAGLNVTVTGWTCTRWAPATFTGCRHELLLESEAGGGLERWLAGLPDAELPLRGHFVAGIEVKAPEVCDGRATVRLAVLTVEES